MPKLDSPFSKEQIKNILLHYDPQYYDRCVDSPDNPDFKVDGLIFPYAGSRPLTVIQGERAMRYISKCVEKYPFNLRRELALELWNTFCEKWDDTGDIRKAMRAI